MNTKKLTDDLLDQAEDFAMSYGIDEALTFVFENIYKE